MTNTIHLKSVVFYFFFIFLCGLYIKALFLYEESKLIYSLFSLTYCGLLFSAVYKPQSYTYLYLTIVLFLGMWLKLTLHLIFKYPYVEPVGSFYNSNCAMDSVLTVSIIGAFAVILSNIVYRNLKLSSTIYIYKGIKFDKPLFYEIYKKYELLLYTLIFILCITLVSVNISYGIQLSGLVPETILPFKLNAIIYWVLGTGFSLLLFVLFTLDIKFENRLELKYLILFIVIVALTSIGLLSRGQFIFMIGSLIVFLFMNLDRLNNFTPLKLLLLIITAAFFYIIVISTVTNLRDFYFSNNISNAANISGSLKTILSLAADRWIGLEGLMAVCSYEQKSFDLFYQSLTAKAQIGYIDIYQYIANAHYKDMDNNKFAFATIPGVMAFLYYTGSKVFVFAILFALTMFVLILEYMIYKWYKSALITSFIGIYFANAIAQFGLTPVNFLKSMFFTFSFLLLFKLIKLKKI